MRLISPPVSAFIVIGSRTPNVSIVVPVITRLPIFVLVTDEVIARPPGVIPSPIRNELDMLSYHIRPSSPNRELPSAWLRLLVKKS